MGPHGGGHCGTCPGVTASLAPPSMAKKDAKEKKPKEKKPKKAKKGKKKDDPAAAEKLCEDDVEEVSLFLFLFPCGQLD